MNDKFQLVWENNPDTPITAGNLSRYVSFYSEDEMLVRDTDAFIGAGLGDDKLKIKANSKVVLDTPVTSAFFDFDKSLISHDSKYTPVAHDNLSDRIESAAAGKNTVALEEGTTNLVVNPSFENDLDDWDVIVTNPGTSSSEVTITSDSLYGSKAAQIGVDASSNQISLEQVVTLPSNTGSASISFYYKAEAGCLLSIEGNPDTTTLFWNTNQDDWIASPSPITLPVSNEYVRYEIKDIGLTSLTTGNTKIKIRIYSFEPNTTHVIDAVQLEMKEFASSFTETTRGDSHFHLDPKLLDLDRGLIEFRVMFKSFDEDVTLATLRTSNPTIDAGRVFLNTSANRLEFRVYDVDISADKSAVITLTGPQMQALLDNWSRIIISWDVDAGIKIYLNQSYTGELNQSYNHVASTDVTEFQIGERDGSNLLNGLLSCVKINLSSKPDDQIIDDLSTEPRPDKKVYKFFENHNKNFIIGPHLVDTGAAASFDASSLYYIYLCDDGLTADTATVRISKNPHAPFGCSHHYSKIIGGFRTRADSTPDEYSLWDVKTSEKKVIHAERFMLHGKDEQSRTIEFRSQPYGEQNDAIFDLPVRFEGPVNFGAAAIDFMTVDASGFLKIDQVTIDNATVVGDTSIQLSAPNDAHVTSENVHINSNASGIIGLDNVNVKGNKIYVDNGMHLQIENDQSSSNVSITATGGRVNVNSNMHITDPAVLRFADSLDQKINLKTTTDDSGIGTQTDSVFLRTPSHISFFKQGTFSTTTYDPGAGGTLLAAITSNEDVSAQVDSSSRLYAGRVYNAVYNDLAECWERGDDPRIDYGDVVVQTENGIVRAYSRAQKGTVGVISNTYGFILGSEGFDDKDIKSSSKLPIAISGRVLVKIKGKAEIGDELVSSEEGYAVRANLFEQIFKRSRIIGQVDSVVNAGRVWMKVR